MNIVNLGISEFWKFIILSFLTNTAHHNVIICKLEAKTLRMC